MQQRVTDAAAERAERLRYQEEAERSAAQVAKLKARQETLLAASAGQGMSAAQVATKEDRDKLLVCWPSAILLLDPCQAIDLCALDRCRGAGWHHQSLVVAGPDLSAALRG